MITTQEELKLKRVAGGSITEHRPLFSSDSLYIYIIWDDGVRQYSIKTGKFVQKLETPNEVVELLSDPEDKNLLHGFTSAGELLTWKQDTGFFENKKTLALKLSSEKKIVGLHLSSNKNAVVVVEDTEKQIHKFIKYNLNTNEKENLPVIGQVGKFSSSVGSSDKDEYLATIHVYNLRVVNLNSSEKFKHTVNPEWGSFSCVRSHPKQNLIATCDQSGRILIWRDVMSFQAIKTLHHWHKLPVNDVVFTGQASSFYSGGSETVIVKWWLDGSQSRDFITNTGASIKNMAISPDNKYVAVGMADNAIHVVNSQMDIEQTIQHVSTHFEERPGVKPIVSRMSFDPRTKALVVNGRSGHVQFYSVENQSYMFLVDVVGQNYLNQQRGLDMVNTEVVLTAMSSDGNWFATVEERDDGLSHLECRLKFWSWDWQHKFKLKTSIENPHQGRVNDIAFQPVLGDGVNRLISTGMNAKFITWCKSEEDSLWTLEFVGKLDNLVPRPVEFSNDTSLYAVGFEGTLSVWETSAMEMKSCLTRPDASERINFVKFGNNASSRYLVAASSSKIVIWDLILLQVVKIIGLKVAWLAANPMNDHMAAFTEGGELVVFLPSEKAPIYRKSILGGKKVSSALYWPHDEVQSNAVGWQRLAQLYFMTDNQEIFTFVSKNEENRDFFNPVEFPNNEGKTATPLAAFVAKQTLSQVKKVEPLPMWKQQVNSYQGSYLKMMCETPSHMLPPMQMLVGELINEYLTAQSSTIEKPQEFFKAPEPMEVIEGSSTDSESEEEGSKVRQKRRKAKTKKLRPVEESTLQSVAKLQFDWVEMLFDAVEITSDEE
ncbi:WD repeat-containing protein 75 isoform X1 [Cloeon dipterum]|uniref:WD repeat-containing protein 75 isoform X1 n=1 Tax=Cloeon dipterum TaxID=197152 RepID=UPI00322087CA